MAIEQIPGGGVIITGEHIKLWQLLQWRAAIQLEEKGVRIARRSVTAHVKRCLKLRGSRPRVLEQINRIIDKWKQLHGM